MSEREQAAGMHEYVVLVWCHYEHGPHSEHTVRTKAFSAADAVTQAVTEISAVHLCKRYGVRSVSPVAPAAPPASTEVVTFPFVKARCPECGGDPPRLRARQVSALATGQCPPPCRECNDLGYLWVPLPSHWQPTPSAVVEPPPR